nr:5471_t:CDS:2 [Entrophospora candida]CAG8455736.1 484_t:CDS:2 [Entrophospora candida]
MTYLIESDYIGEVALSNLKYYKYSAIDKSPISNYILKPYWNWAIELFPLWMAPNLITLCGLGFVFINMLCVIFWIPDLVGPGPTWLYWSFPVGLWLYSTFDNVDGKQARRTGTSSPLGELFDHGCDALNCSLESIVLAASFGLGHSGYAAYFLLSLTVPFYMSTWEEYHTGTLYLGYFNGPTEGIIIACIAICVSAIVGPQLWMKELHDIFGELVPSFIPASTKLMDLMIIAITITVFIIHIPACLYNVYVACKAKDKSFLATLPQLFAIVLYSFCGYLWLSSPNSYILKNQHFILFTLTVGIVFGRVATKIILAHVTKMPFPMYTVLLIPLFLGAVLTNFPRFFGTKEILSETAEYVYLWAYFAFATIAYFHWAFLVIDRFCAHLKIQCLRIPYRTKDDEDDERQPLLS